MIKTRTNQLKKVMEEEDYSFPKGCGTFFKSPEPTLTIKMRNTPSKRNFLDVCDICETFLILLEKKLNHKIYKTNSSKYLSIKQILKILEEET